MIIQVTAEFEVSPQEQEGIERHVGRLLRVGISASEARRMACASYGRHRLHHEHPSLAVKVLSPLDSGKP